MYYPCERDAEDGGARRRESAHTMVAKLGSKASPCFELVLGRAFEQRRGSLLGALACFALPSDAWVFGVRTRIRAFLAAYYYGGGTASDWEAPSPDFRFFACAPSHRSVLQRVARLHYGGV